MLCRQLLKERMRLRWCAPQLHCPGVRSQRGLYCMADEPGVQPRGRVGSEPGDQPGLGLPGFGGPREDTDHGFKNCARHKCEPGALAMRRRSSAAATTT